MSKQQMSIEDFDLLVRSIHREWLRDPSKISLVNESIFFVDVAPGTSDVKSCHIFINGDTIWPHILKEEFKVDRPWPWNRSKCKQLDAALQLLQNIRNDVKGEQVTTEQLICHTVASAKDIIAERTLVNDHGPETSDSDPQGS